MLNLNDREWKAFFICDIFSLESTSSGIDGNKLSKEQGNIPYLTRTDLNNGYKSFVGQQAEKYKIDSGNCITIGLDTQTAFYQPHSFYTGQNIQVLKNENLDKYNAKFFIPLLHNAMVSLNWGGNGATLGRLKKKKIVVPITDDGQPDYVFMEQYIREREDNLKQKYIDFVNTEFAIPPVPLIEKEWGEFFIGDLFKVKRPKARSEKDYKEGSYPFVASGNFNNGVIRYCEPHNETLDKGNCITVSPVDGSAFYQKGDFLGRGGAGSSILLLYCANINEYSGMFITRLIRQTCSKYNYGKMGNQDSIKRERILLPITNDGNPDYDYMEQYIKVIMFGKYKKYLEYQNCLIP